MIVVVRLMRGDKNVVKWSGSMCCFSCVTVVRMLLHPPTGSRKMTSEGSCLADATATSISQDPREGTVKTDVPTIIHDELNVQVPDSSDDE